MDDQKHQVIALLVKAGNVIRYGVNQIRYVRETSYFSTSLHAEADLIRQCSHDELSGAKIFVYRFNNSMAPDAREPKASAPCPLCAHMLHTAGVGKVWYMNTNTEVEMKRGRDFALLTDHPYNITAHFAEKQKYNRQMRFEPAAYLAA